MRSKFRLLSLVLVAALVAAACGSSSSSSGTGGAGGKTVTIGVLTDLTGLASSTEKGVPAGIKAGVGAVKAEGYTVKYDVIDGQSSPSAVLAAAHKLVEQDHVFAIIAISSFTFAAAPYLASKGVPVIGAAVDANEWTTDRNMFSVNGTVNFNDVYTTTGDFCKAEGTKTVGLLGYSISPSSAATAKADAISATAAGLKVGYLNANFPFGSTNVGPEVIAMKNAGVDCYTGTVETSTSFSILQALRQSNVPVKAALLPIGYGGDLFSGGASAEQAAQGVFFTSYFEPVEMHTAATEKMMNAFKTYAGLTTDPAFNQYLGYVSVDAIVAGLKKAGSKPTQKSFIDAMQATTSYDAAGLLGAHPIGFSMAQRGQSNNGNLQCSFVAQFKGSTFHVVPSMAPLCGTKIQGKHV